ncbi:MAG: hypothetical protein AB8F95_00795 [Bacteroidia bacterium]
MKRVSGIVLIILSIAAFGFRYAQKVEFKQNVSGHLKRAADASTIELAHEELSQVVDYLEANNLTSGSTSIMYETPNEDIDFWYRNIKASRDELQNKNLKTQLEKTNVLIKLRETLLDTGERTKVTIPKGLSVYPHNLAWGLGMLAATIALFVGLSILAVDWDAAIKAKEAAKAD